MSLKLSKIPSSEERKRLKKLVVFESAARKKGYSLIAGVDEAGRGPLAGPVVAAACLIAPRIFFSGITDSKLLTPKRRHELFEQLTRDKEIAYGVGIVDHTTIDKVNILQATKMAMCQAVENLSVKPDYLLIDAVVLERSSLPQQSIIKGDRRSQSIAAASIIAKQTRDTIMLKYHKQYPLYGFGDHKGYGTQKHRDALYKHGPCPIHRRSFEPVKSLFSKQNSSL